MPVDLSSLPPRAKRQSFPSFQRWAVFFLFLFLIINAIDYFLFPQLEIKRVSALNLFIFTVLIWLLLYILRYFAFLLNQWVADGWDTQREKDEKNRISIGQRNVTLVAQAMYLPHVTNCKDLSTQISTAKAPLLSPSQINDKTVYCAQFIDDRETDVIRVINKLKQLLSDPTLLSAIQHLPEKTQLTIMLSLGTNLILEESDKQQIERQLVQTLGKAVKINYTGQINIDLIDNWLDNPNLFEFLLVIGISLFNKQVEQYSEVAVAQLFASPQQSPETYIARVHRPEKTLQSVANLLDPSIETALLWGDISPQQLNLIWLTSVSKTNKDHLKTEILSTERASNLTLYDLDNAIGYTQPVSPWVNLYISATQLAKTRTPQLIIDIQNNEKFIWVINPPR